MIGVFVDGMLDESIEYLEFINDKKTVCVFNYTEAGNMVHDDQLKLINAYPKCRFIDPNWYIFNVAVLSTSYLKELGGYDCRFQTTAVSHADLAARTQRDGCSTRLFNKPMLKCSHLPDTSRRPRSHTFCHSRRSFLVSKSL